MLSLFRDGGKARFIKITALSFVLLGVSGMVFMDVGGFFRTGITHDTLAKIGGTRITLQSFERMASPVIRGQNMSMEEAYRFGLLNSLLDEMITREVLRQEALAEGLVVSREAVAKEVMALIEKQIRADETPQQALDRILRERGVRETDLVASMKQGMTARLIELPLAASVQNTPQLVRDTLARFHAERRDIAFFTITPALAGRDITPDDATLKAYYDGIREQYQIPERRTFRVFSVSTQDLKPTHVITDADVRTAYNERKDSFKIGEQRTVEQAVLETEALATQALEAMRAGRNLKSLVKPAAYREPQSFEKAALPAELADPIFTASKGGVIGPIKTALGWHVLKLTDIQPARNQTFEEVAVELKKELESDAVHADMEERISKIEEALANGNSIDQIATSMSATLRSVGPIDAKGTIENPQNADPVLTSLANNRDLLSALFELMEGETGELVEVSDGVFAVFSLEKVIPSADRAFEDVKADVQTAWLKEKQGEALDTKVEALMTAINSGKKTFDEAATDMAVPMMTVRDVRRDSKVAGLNDPVALSRLFDETNLNAVVTVKTEQGTLLAKVLAARIPNAPDASKKVEIERQVNQQMERAVSELYLSALKAQHKVIVNQDVLAKQYGTESNEKP